MVKSTRKRKSVPVASLLPTVARKAYRKYGFVETSVVTRWREIVGDTLANNTEPVRLQFRRGQRGGGTLHLVAEGAFAVEVQHLAPRIIERINAFHGYAAVADLKIRQGRIKRTRKEPAARSPNQLPNLSEAAAAELDSLVDSTPDSDLKEAIRRLGTRVLANTESRDSAPLPDIRE